MKKFMLFLIAFVFISSVYANDEKRIILKNNYYSSGELGFTCLTDKSIFKMMAGLSYFYEFDTINYKGKTIGYIVNDLSEKYQLLESKTYSGWEKFKEEDYFRRTNFSFKFKKDDTTAIHLNGCFEDKNIFIERDDSVALEQVLMQDGFLMEALLIDYRKKYLELIEISKIDSSDGLRNAIEYCKKYFPKACE